jgi:hypothetical protein
MPQECFPVRAVAQKPGGKGEVFEYDGDGTGRKSKSFVTWLLDRRHTPILAEVSDQGEVPDHSVQQSRTSDPHERGEAASDRQGQQPGVRKTQRPWLGAPFSSSACFPEQRLHIGAFASPEGFG